MDEKKSKRKKAAKATPLPKGQMLVVGLVTFSNFFGITVIFPMLPFMTHDFFPHLEKSQLGFYAGFLASSYHFGSFLGNILWGRLSDRWGRRPVFLFGLFSASFAVAMFGLSVNFAMALSARFLWGLLGANMAMAKTYLSDLCDDTNQARAFSLLGICAGVGRLFAVSVGGFLSQPAQKYFIFENRFFCRFPYFLPCLVSLVQGIAAFVVAWFYLVETADVKGKKDSASKWLKSEGDELNEKATFTKNDDDDDDDLCRVEINLKKPSSRRPRFSLCQSCTSANDQLDYETIAEVGIAADDVEDDDVDARRRRRRRSSVVQALDFSATKMKLCCKDVWDVIKLLKNKAIGLVILEFCVFTFVSSISMEIVSLLLVTDGDHGGYCFSSSQISIPITAVAVIQIIFQLLVYHRIVGWLKFRKTAMLGIIVFGAGSIMMPFLVQMTGPIRYPNATLSNTNVAYGNSPNFTNNSTSLFNFTTTTTPTSSFVYPSANSSSPHFSCLQYGYSWYNSTIDEDDENVGNSSIARQCHVVIDGKLHTSTPTSHVRIEIWIAVTVFAALLYLGRSVGFTSINVLVCNSAKRSIRGSVTGLNQSAASIARMIGPSLGSYLFAWSESNGYGYPLNYHFVFGFTSSVCVIAIVIGCLLPESTSERIKEEHKEEAPAKITSDDAAKLLDGMEMSQPEISETEQRESTA
ncbi:uncharacterized protein [Oscarella lobularis]|uniref:uncharacterized protein isoform X2 n=1 Tax=Oscarella lobularis TaxID=121494 RepID=UPI00331419CA